MNKEDLKDKVLGNYLVDNRNDFPLDCETFDYIQNNNFITEILGNIAGDKCFIYGCEWNGAEYEPGYAFLRTTEHPEGEILPFTGGWIDSGELCIKSDGVRVTANDKTYDPAYTKRRLSFVTTQYDKIIAEVDEFTYASYNKPLYGEIKIWSGPLDKIPAGYYICDGSAFDKRKYRNLYKVIGDKYNEQHKGSHTTYNKQEDYYRDPGPDFFRIPDLSERFIVGCNSEGRIHGGDDDVNPNGYDFGSQGGLSTCKLTHKQSGLPEHAHPDREVWTFGAGGHRHWAAADNNSWRVGINNLGNYEYANDVCAAEGTGAGGTRQTSPVGDHSHKVVVPGARCKFENAEKSHENKPPFMVLCYIIRCR